MTGSNQRFLPFGKRKSTSEKAGIAGKASGTKQPHNFWESLAKSHAAADLPIWEEVYRKAFPLFQTMVDYRKNGDHQKAGIDRGVYQTNSEPILIDEKIRYDDYGDIALEYWSDHKNSS